jgi:hypothetical protein
MFSGMRHPRKRQPANHLKKGQSPMLEIIVERKTWLRGTGSGASALLRNTDKKRCCLGFVAQQSGVTDQNMCGMATPENLPDFYRMPADLLTDGCNSNLCFELMQQNDDHSVTDEVRERRLNGLLDDAEASFRFKFVDEVTA